MRESDLMLGDWVLYMRKPIQIKDIVQLRDGRYCFNSEWEFNEIVDSIDPEDIFPIPLTYGILEKNGFSATVGPGGLFQLALEGLNVRVDFNIVRYIHQLQHALRLCGIDKEITL